MKTEKTGSNSSAWQDLKEMMKAEDDKYFNPVQLIAGVLAPDADPGENQLGFQK